MNVAPGLVPGVFSAYIAFLTGVASLLATVTLSDGLTGEVFGLVIGGITTWCVDNLTREEKERLAEMLQNPLLTFASPVSAQAASELAAALVQ